MNKLAKIIFLIAIVKTIFFAHIGYGLLDEGESLHNAVRILNGNIPYRDFFAIFPPLDNYFFAIVFGIFGKSILIPRLTMSVIFSMGIFYCYQVVRKLSSPILAFLVCLLIIFSDLNAERVFFFAPVFLCLHYLFSQPKNKPKRYFVAGFLLGLVAIFRADIPGSYLVGILFVLIFSLKISLAKLRTFLIGCSVFPLIIFCYLLFNNLLPEGLNQMLVKSVEITKLHSLPFPPLSALLVHSFSLTDLISAFTAVLGYSILFVYLCTALVILKDRKLHDERRHLSLVLLCAGVFSLPYLFGRSDMGHFIKAGMPAFLLSGFVLNEVKNLKVKVLFWGALLSFVFAFIIQSFWWVQFNNYYTVIGGFSLVLHDGYIQGSTNPSPQTLKKAVEFVDSHSKTGEKVLLLPYMAGVYFLADREGPNQYNNVLNGFVAGVDEDQFIQSIKDSSVNVIVYDRKNGPKMKHHALPEYNAKIDAYIMNNFEIKSESQEGWLFMLKK